MDEVFARNLLVILEMFVGRDNAVSRSRLAHMAGVSDREARAGIEVLRRVHPKGALICSHSSVSGYWMAESLDEVKELYRQKRGQALKMMFNARRQLSAAERYFAEQDAFKNGDFEQMELIA